MPYEEGLPSMLGQRFCVTTCPVFWALASLLTTAALSLHSPHGHCNIDAHGVQTWEHAYHRIRG
jgi:hypothetical protein